MGSCGTKKRERKKKIKFNKNRPFFERVQRASGLEDHEEGVVQLLYPGGLPLSSILQERVVQRYHLTHEEHQLNIHLSDGWRRIGLSGRLHPWSEGAVAAGALSGAAGCTGSAAVLANRRSLGVERAVCGSVHLGLLRLSNGLAS